MIDIDKLILESMKSKDQISLKAYKNLKAEIQLVKTAKNAKPYNDATESQLLIKYCKKLADAIIEFRKAGRDDLMREYEAELGVLTPLLPRIPTEDEIKACIKDYKGEKNFGLIMKHVKSTLPLADGAMASRIIKEMVK